MAKRAINISSHSDIKVDELLPDTVVAKWLNVSRPTLARDRLKGDGIPFVKLGSKKQSIVRYRRSDVEAYIASRLRRSTSDNGEVAV